MGALNDVETKASNSYFSASTIQLVQIHSVATDTELGSGALYPLKVATTPVGEC